MIYANDEIFNIGYNSKLDRLEIRDKRKTNIIKKFLINNRIITTLILLFIMFCILNSILIYTFMQLLKNF